MSTIRSGFGFFLMLLSLLALAATAVAHGSQTRHDLALALLSEPDQPIDLATPSQEHLDAIGHAHANAAIIASIEREAATIERFRARGAVIVTSHFDSPLVRMFLNPEAYNLCGQQSLVLFSPEWDAADNRLAERIVGYEPEQLVVPIGFRDKICYDGCEYWCWTPRDTEHEQGTQRRFNQLSSTRLRQRRFAPQPVKRRGAYAMQRATMGLSWQRQG